MSKSWIYSSATLLIISLLALYFIKKYHVAPEINFKELKLVNMEDHPANLEDYKGKRLILSFGASWCGACREELKVLRLIKENELKEIEIVVVSDESLEKIRSFKETGDFPFIFLRSETPFSAIGINSLPTTYFINNAFEVKKKSTGYVNWKDPSTLQHLKKLIQ